MTVRNAVPVSWFPKSLSNCVDSTPVFPGAMLTLQNLIPDVSTKDVWQCRPAAQQLVDFSLTGGQFSNAFSSAFALGLTGPGAFISCLKVVGNRAYGMIASTSVYPGKDVPFSYNLVNGMFDPITGETANNLPISPNTSGAWTPPTADVIGTKLIITHPGFNTLNGYFGILDISDPTAPVWSSGNTATTALAAVPVAVKQFNQRAWYLVNPSTGQPGAYFSDVLDPLTITDPTHILTFDDNVPLTALGALPLSNQLGGVIQALIVFKGTSNMYQVTGDAALTNSPLTRNALNIATGTLAPNSICSTPKGLMFMAPDGMRLIDFNAVVSDPIGIEGMGMTMPFQFSVVPSRVAAACNLSVVRISTQDGSDPGNPFEEYWYDMGRSRWSGPHTFPASLIQPYTNTFIMAPHGVISKLFQSDAVQSATSTFVENGVQMSFVFTTSLLPNTGRIAENYISEATVDMALVSGVSYPINVLDPQFTVLDSTSVISALASGAVWGSFTWGSATWGSAASHMAPRKVNFTKPIVTDQMYFQVNGACAQAIKIGKLYFRYSPLGYLVNEAA